MCHIHSFLSKLNLPAGWFPQSHLPRASWWLAPSSATAGGPKPRPDRLALWLTGPLHSSIVLLARGTCCLEALTEVRTQTLSLSVWTLAVRQFVLSTEYKYFSKNVCWFCVAALKVKGARRSLSKTRINIRFRYHFMRSTFKSLT